MCVCVCVCVCVFVCVFVCVCVCVSEREFQLFKRMVGVFFCNVTDQAKRLQNKDTCKQTKTR